MAYHSKEVLDIYHECKNCTVGNNIEPENLVPGKPPGARLCKPCKKLQEARDCEPGIPTPAR